MELSAEDLMRQAGMTADTYLRDAVKSISSVFGEEYPYEHPELVGQFMRVAVMDYAAVSAQDSAEHTAGMLEGIATALSDIATALENIAGAV